MLADMINNILVSLLTTYLLRNNVRAPHVLATGNQVSINGIEYESDTKSLPIFQTNKLPMDMFQAF
jgi:hypothetical protein